MAVLAYYSTATKSLEHGPRFCNPDAARRGERGEQARPGLGQGESQGSHWGAQAVALPMTALRHEEAEDTERTVMVSTPVGHEARGGKPPGCILGETFDQPHDQLRTESTMITASFADAPIARRQMHHLQQDEVSKAQLRGVSVLFPSRRRPSLTNTCWRLKRDVKMTCAISDDCAGMKRTCVRMRPPALDDTRAPRTDEPRTRASGGPARVPPLSHPKPSHLRVCPPSRPPSGWSS